MQRYTFFALIVRGYKKKYYICSEKRKCKKIMATTTAKRRTEHSIDYYWDLVKDLNDSEKLELVIMLVQSVKESLDKTKQQK